MQCNANASKILQEIRIKPIVQLWKHWYRRNNPCYRRNNHWKTL